MIKTFIYLDEIDRRRRSVLAYPFQGNANYQFSFPVEEEGNTVGNDNGKFSIFT